MKRIFAVAPLLVATVLMQAGITAEASVFCSEDPAIHFIGARGHSQTVYLTTYGEGLQHLAAVTAQAYSYTVQWKYGGHKTRVRLRVRVPDDGRKHFHVRFVISTYPNGAGRVLTRHKGDSGHTYKLDFGVPS